MRRMLGLGAVLAVGAATAVAGTSTAGAGAPDRVTIHDEGAFVEEDFCGVDGLAVAGSFVLDIRVQSAARRRGGLFYFLQHGLRTEVLTNPASGKSVTTSTRVVEKDLRVTDNGDGTLTVLVLATGNSFVSGEDGKVIARDPGQIRFKLLVDDGGTPTDPTDDQVIGDLGVVKPSTGRSDDFCAAVVPALT